MEINTSIQYLAGVGPKMAEKLKRLGIETVRDLLFYFPWRYDDFSHPQKISALRIGQDAIIKAKIAQIKKSRTFRKRINIIEARLVDRSGEIKAIWFNQPFLMNVLKPGDEWLFAGRINFDFKNKTKNFSVTQYEKESSSGALILPVYSETEGLNSKYLRKINQPLIEDIDNLIEDFLPKEIAKEENLVNLEKALKDIHSPKNTKEIKKAKERLGFDELFLITLKMLIAKKELQKEKAPSMKIDNKILKSFVRKLPFKLTNAQRKSAWEIIKNLSRTIPMNRLLEGDVGSGKTVVAIMAVLVAAKNKYQTVWLAPTEILANQHYQNISKILKEFKIKVGILTSANKTADLKNDDLIIGTHAILQKNIHIPRLSLIIIDEQHRFGVKQRAHLRQKKDTIPHLLSMTATPIPRTLALALYGDLDLSIIDEMPLGRKKVTTKVIEPEERKEAYSFIYNQVKKGHQVFVICPLIEIKENHKINLFEADRKSAIEEYQKLSKNIFPDLKIGLMHGRLKSKEKDKVMKKFSKGNLDIMVSTAVVEVGIDVPNATVMMVESAERFGLAQLHQFRGRVGRSTHQSFCFLFAESWSEKTKKRLEAMVGCHNGFKLAEIDLKIRGPGELTGIRQAGLPDLKMATLQDTILIRKARKVAQKIVTDGIENYPKLADELSEFIKERHLE